VPASRAENSIHSYFNHKRLLRQLLRNCSQRSPKLHKLINQMTVVNDYLQFRDSRQRSAWPDSIVLVMLTKLRTEINYYGRIDLRSLHQPHQKLSPKASGKFKRCHGCEVSVILDTIWLTICDLLLAVCNKDEITGGTEQIRVRSSSEGDPVRMQFFASVSL